MDETPKHLWMALQPIVNLDTGDIVAHESLLRGPQGSRWESPQALFETAERLGHREALEAHARKLAVTRLKDLPNTHDGLKRLKLCHTRDHLDEYCQLAATRDLSFREFLKLIMTEELAARDETQRVKRLRAARIPQPKTLAAFDWAFQPSLPKREILELHTLRFVAQHDNVILLGPPGLGKTYMPPLSRTKPPFRDTSCSLRPRKSWSTGAMRRWPIARSRR